MVSRVGQGFASLGTTFGVLGIRDFRWYWLATVSYYIGFFTEILARGWLAYELTQSAVLLGVVVVTQGVPQALLAVLGGVLADRVKKRTLIMCAQGVLTLSAITLAVLVVTGVIAYWQLVALSLVAGVSIGLSLPARLAFVSELVPGDRFVRAYSLYYVANNTMRVGGPAVGGIVTAFLGIGVTFLLIAVAHGICFFLLLAARLSEAERPPQVRPILRDLAETFAFASRTPVILLLMLTELGIVFFVFSSINLMPVFASAVFNAGPAGLGTLLSAVGVGGLIGSVFVAAIGGTRRKSLLLLSAGVFQGMMLFLLAGAPALQLAALAAGLVGFGNAIYVTINSTMFQLNSPPEMRGRVTSLYLLGQAFQPIGVAPLSVLADSVGIQIAVAGAGGILICFMIGISLGFPNFRRLQV